MIDVVVSGAAAFIPVGDELSQRRDHVRLNRLSRLALAAVEPALDDAGLAKPLGATALILGSAFGPHATNEQFYRGFLDGEGSARAFAATLPSAPLGDISIQLHATGLAMAFTPGRHAALVALAHARRHLLRGRAERVVLIVADLATPLLRQLLHEPVADGAAALVLETAAACAARGGRVRGHLRQVVCSYGAQAMQACMAAVAPAARHSLATPTFDSATAVPPACALVSYLIGEEPDDFLLAASDPAGGAGAALFSRH